MPAADCQKSHGCDRSHNNLLLLQLVTNIVIINRTELLVIAISANTSDLLLACY